MIQKRFLILMMFVLVISILTGCNKTGESGDDMKDKVIIGSAMNKYEQRYVFKDDEKLHEINISAAKNEYEPTQIILVGGKDGINSYNIELNDLILDDNNKITKDNITVYSAYYNSISNSQNGFPSGYYPDVLIPLADRLSYGDNTVAKSEIQSLWLSFYVPKGIKSGKYTSTFGVIIDGEKINIPVNLEVYDFELPDETHVKSAFAIWGPTYGNDMLSNIYGKRALAAENNYYEMMLKYRIAPTSLPNLDLSDPEIWVNDAVQYAARKDVPSFSLPFRSTAGKYPEWFDEDFMHDVLSLLVDKSTEEVNVFDKLYAYGVVDEPDYTGLYEKARDFTATMQKIINTVLDEKEKEGAFENKPSVKEGLKNLATLITIGLWGDELGDLGDNVTGYCPKFEVFDKEENRNDFAKLQEEGVSIWAYGCNVPGWPYPTYQVDADLVSPRSIGVLQMMYNIEGNLFWLVNQSRVFNGSQYTDNWDPYETAYAFSTWPGDGYLVAPAGKYNSKSLKPYPTMRLEMVREGQEDYEYLYLLKELVAAKGEDALAKLEERLAVEYATIFDGSKPTEDPAKMIQFKNTIVSLILENK